MPAVDAFNPYQQWLGLSPALRHPSYYELLDISPRAASRDVASAADRALSRVRAQQPGPHARQWAELLDLLTAAKARLLDPQQRAEYDRALGVNAPPAPQPNFAYPPTAAAAGESNDPMAPFAGHSPAMTVTSPPAATANGSHAAHDPMAPVAPGAYARTSAPAQPRQPAPVAIPAARPMASADPLVPATTAPYYDPLPAMPAAPRKSSTARQVTRRSRNSWALLVAASVGAVCAALLLAGLIFAAPYLLRGMDAGPEVVSRDGDTADGGPIRETTNHRHDDPSGGDSSDGAETIPPGSADREEAGPAPPDNPGVIPLPPLTPGPEADPVPVETFPPDPSPAEPPLTESPPSEFPIPTDTVPVEPIPAEPAPPAEPPGPTAEQVRQLAAALKSARRFLKTQEVEAAQRQLDEASALPMLPEHELSYLRLSELVDYVGQFQQAMQDGLGTLIGGDSFQVGDSTMVALVEKRPEYIKVRVAGTNHTYPMDKLPIGLAVALADLKLAQGDPATLVVKAAFVGTHGEAQEVQIEKARGWWSDALGLGAEIDSWPAVFEDEYDLKWGAAPAALPAKAEMRRDTLEPSASGE